MQRTVRVRTRIRISKPCFQLNFCWTVCFNFQELGKSVPAYKQCRLRMSWWHTRDWERHKASLLLSQRETFGNLLSLGYCENKDLSTSKTCLSPIYYKLFLFYTSNIENLKTKKFEHKTASAWMRQFYIYNKPYQILNFCINAFEKWCCVDVQIKNCHSRCFQTLEIQTSYFVFFHIL